MAERPAPPLLLAATVDTLRRHAPFDAMAAEDVAFLAARVKLRYFAEGTAILSPGAEPVSHLYIIQRGRVRGDDAAQTSLHEAAFTLAEGECFPIGALIGKRPTSLVYSAVSDTFCYVLEATAFNVLLERSREFHSYCTRRLAHFVDLSHRAQSGWTARRAGAELSLASPLSSVIRREPVTLPDTASVRDMLMLMKSRRIGSVVLTSASGEPAGIFTQSDVLDRVALAGIDLDSPARSVMTPDPKAIAANSPAAEAAHAMARGGFRHVLVTDQQRLVGVVSERDLFALQRRSMQGLRKEIARAASREDLAHAAGEVRALAASLLAQGVAPEPLTQLVTALNDAIVETAVRLGNERVEVASLGACWMGLGSEGRMEQTLATDQDNAIVFPDEGDLEGSRNRLLAFANEVNETLDAAGFPLCKGDIMARNPRWCLSLREWQACFDDWMLNVHPESLMNAAIFFDFRPLVGASELAERLREFVLAQVKHRPAFLRQMTANALEVRPPLGLLGDLVVEDDKGTIDLKTQASRPFVDAARILALSAGVPETSTAGRLRAAGPVLRMSADEVGSAVDAFHYVQILRLRNQHQTRETGEAPNRVDPDTLNALDRRILREALRQARKLQNRLALDFQL